MGIVVERDEAESALADVPAAIPDQPGVSEQAVLARKHQIQWNVAAAWLFLLAGLTMANGALWLFGSSTRLVPSLIATRMLTKVLKTAFGMGTLTTVLELAAVLVAGAVFVALGLLVLRQRGWAMLAAIGLYAADLVLYVVRLGDKNQVMLSLRVIVLAVLVGTYLAIRRPKPTGEVANEPPDDRAVGA
jgi:hypothetical protein